MRKHHAKNLVKEINALIELIAKKVSGSLTIKNIERLVYIFFGKEEISQIRTFIKNFKMLPSEAVHENKFKDGIINQSYIEAAEDLTQFDPMIGGTVIDLNDYPDITIFPVLLFAKKFIEAMTDIIVNQKIPTIPKSIGKFENLETLVIRDNLEIEDLPIELGDLTTLELLDIRGWQNLILSKALMDKLSENKVKILK